jgi:hypothetical protein
VTVDLRAPDRATNAALRAAVAHGHEGTLQCFVKERRIALSFREVIARRLVARETARDA